MRNRRITLFSSLAAFALACGNNPLPPPAPSVDPIASPTSLAQITVTGSAQPAARIGITGAAAVDPATVVADPFTARFRAVVTLAHNARNTLAFTATDRGGRKSQATTVAIDQSDAFAASIQNLLVNGVPCAPVGAPPACPATTGAVIEFDVVGNSTFAVSEVQYTALFSTAGGSGTLRSQRVLVAPNSPLPYVQHFVFTVPGVTLFETVPVEALVIDAQGNRFTSPPFALRASNIDAAGRRVAAVAVGGLLNAPNGISFDAAGNLYIANDGQPNLLKLSRGGTSATIFSAYGGRSSYLASHGAGGGVGGGGPPSGPGDLYVSDGAGGTFRVAPDGTVVNYLSFSGGLKPTGLTISWPTPAKGLVTVGGAIAGNTVTAGSKLYEFQPNGVGCSAGNVCVDLNAPNKTEALATAVQANSVEVYAVFNVGSGRAVIYAKNKGSAGNLINLATSNAVAITLSPTGGKLGEGHDETLFVGQTGAADTNVYRFAENLAGLPAGTTANEGAFSTATQQRGVAVVDYSPSALNSSLRTLDLYFIDDVSPRTLRGVQVSDAATPRALFSIAPGGDGGDLYDVVALGNGCLLVSDQAAGKIYSVFYSVDPRYAAVATVATGFKKPRGLTKYAGELYVADNTLNAVVRISPLDRVDCF